MVLEEGIARLLQDTLGARRVTIENLRGLAGGYSRETFVFDAAITHGDGREERRGLILRRDPAPGSAIVPSDRGVEFRVLQRVKPLTGFPAPLAVALDETGDYVERPGLVIERLPGKSDLSALVSGEDRDQLESVATHLVETLATLHNASQEGLDPDGEMRDPLGRGSDVSSWDAYMRSQIRFLKENYVTGAFDALPVFFDAYCSLEHRLPRPTTLRFIHGDFQPPNYLYKDGRITGIIDWEIAHIGDPREDLGALLHVQELMGWDIMGAVKKEGGFLPYYEKLTGVPVNEEELKFFRLLWISEIQTGALAAVKRRLDGEHNNFMHLYIIQPIMLGMMPFAAQLGYPTVEKDA